MNFLQYIDSIYDHDELTIHPDLVEKINQLSVGGTFFEVDRESWIVVNESLDTVCMFTIGSTNSPYHFQLLFQTLHKLPV